MEGTIDQNRLIAILLEEKLVNKKQIKDALTEQEKTRKAISDILLEMRLVTPGVLSEIQARAMGLDHVRLSDIKLEPGILKIIPKRFAVEHRVIPVGLSGNTLTVAMEKPQDVLTIDEIKMLTGYNIRAVVSSNKDIDYGLGIYPAEDSVAEVAPIRGVSRIRQAIQFLAFMLVLVLPLFIVPYIASFRNEWVIFLSNFDNLLMFLIGWGFYAVILFYIYSVLFEPQESSTKSKPE